ncbi:MAG: diaminopimelate epimerase [Actinobacteria bacterium]|nr:diaminopimelate epimerase [Actinomycetota bacterium]
MKKICFSKLNGQGNDFILIDATGKELKIGPQLIKKMCDRHFGIGADGLILVKNSNKADFYMDYYNQDGSKAEMCGNGIRCMSSFIIENKMTSEMRLQIDTLAGIKTVTADKSREKLIFRVDMGMPEFLPSKIPVNHESTGKVLNYKLESSSRVFDINCVSMGNPHCVIFLRPGTDLKSIPLKKWGPEIENHGFFPGRTNVEFVKYRDEGEIDVRVWERGVGETLACGTGACAAGVISMVNGMIKERCISVNMPGGALIIEWENDGAPVFLKGSVSHSYDGTYYL